MGITKGISYDFKDQSVTVSGGTTEAPATLVDVKDHINKDPHYILDNFKKLRPEIYRHIVGLLISLHKEQSSCVSESITVQVNETLTLGKLVEDK